MPMRPLVPIIDRYLPEIVTLRHNIHENPEIGYEEIETSAKIVKRLEEKGGFDIQTGIAKTGIVATLGSHKSGKGIALRADMDCLPILEDSGKDWASKRPGYMHACGHDGHTSCLLGTALVLSDLEDSLKGPVKFIFQPAEEGGAGGEKMVAAGVLDNPKVDMIFGLHGWPSLELGQITTCKGPMMANADEFEITIHGRGGHAAVPQNCIDPIVVASHIVTALQSVSSRNTAPEDSVVVTVAKIEGGTAFNIIPDSVTMLGTIRTLSQETQQNVFDRIHSIASGVAESMGARAEVRLTRGYPVLSNHPKAVDYLETVFDNMESPVTQISSIFPQMVGEDFAYFAQNKPGCFFGLGLKPPQAESYPHLHRANFDFNDDALPIGMRCFSELVLNFWDY
jgi:amidohydrolase